MKFKVMLCEQFLEVEAETDDEACQIAARTFAPQVTPDDFVAWPLEPTSESEGAEHADR